MILVLPLLASLLVAPFVAIVWTTRDRQLMATAVGTLEPAGRVRGDRTLQSAAAPWSALVPLLRIEGGRLLRHPAPYLIGVPLLALGLSNFLYSSVENLARADVGVVILLVPYAWGTLIASNLLTLRSRRWRSDELLRSTPVPERSRTLVHLAASLVMVPGAVVLVAVWYLAALLSGRTIGAPRIETLAVGPLVVVGAGCVGVAVARWLPRPVFGWVAVIATLMLQVNFGHLDPRWRWLHFSMYGNESINYPDFSPEHHLVHLGYLVAGILLVCAVALARDGIDVGTGGLLAASVALLVVTGLAQVRPLSGNEISSFAQRVEDPGWNQRCEGRERFTLCVDPAFVDLVPMWEAPVRGVLDRVPPSASPAPALVLRQRPMIDARVELLDEVAASVDPSVVWPDDEEVSLSRNWALAAPEDSDDPGRVQLSLAYRVASANLGLPPDAWWSQSTRGTADWTRVALAEPLADSELRAPVLGPMVQCVAADQARSVAAVWLAGQSTPEARTELRRLAGEVLAQGRLATAVTFDAVGTYREGLPDPLPEQGAVVHGSDVVAAAALLERDDAAVTSVLHQHWPDVTSQASPLASSELLGWFGTGATEAEATVARTAPPADVEPHPEDMMAEPAASGPCPSQRYR